MRLLSTLRLRWSIPGMVMAIVSLCLSGLAYAQEDQDADDFLDISRDAVQKRIQELDQASNEEIDGRIGLLDRYRELDEQMAAATRFEDLARSFQASLESTPADIQELETTLAAAGDEPLRDLTGYDTTDELEPILDQMQSEVANADARLAELEKNLAEARSRPELARQRLVEAQSLVLELEQELRGKEIVPDSEEAEQVDYWLLQARYRARSSEIQMLEQELLSHPIRVSLLELKREEAKQRLERLNQESQRVEAKFSKQRQVEAEDARIEAEKLRQEAIDKQPLIREIAISNSEIAREAERLTSDIDQTRRDQQDDDLLLEQLRSDHEEIRQAIELTGTESLGDLLIEQRRQLPSPRTIEESRGRIRDRIAELRLRSLRIKRELREYRDPRQIVTWELDKPIADPTTRADETGLVELRRVVDAKKENLGRLNRTLGDLIEALGRREVVQGHLINELESLNAILEERLLWLRNASPLGLVALAEAAKSLGSLVDSQTWTRAFQALQKDIDRAPTSYFLMALALAATLVIRRRGPSHLEELAKKIGRVREDSLTITLKALTWHLARSLPLPATVFFLGSRLHDHADSAPSTQAIGAALVTAAIVFGFLRTVRAFFRPHGVAVAHFGWSALIGRVIRKQLLWFSIFATFMSFFVMWSRSRGGGIAGESLERVSLIALCFGVVILGALSLYPQRHAIMTWMRRPGMPIIKKLLPFWLPLLFVIPIVLAIMVATGYHYGAIQVGANLDRTLLLAFGTLLLHATLYRWLLISQRRLALKVAMEKRAAIAKSREAEAETDGEGMVDLYESVDVSEIKEQTQDLLQVSMTFLLVIGIWFIWSPMLPAFRVFDSLTLWHHSTVEDGLEVLRPITLTNVLLAILLVIATVVAARKMPSFLEIALLQRLPVDAGARHAARTLILYAIVSLGIVSSFNAIGIGWSSVQWLVAALTVGLGFGLQEIFANFVSGLILLLERPIRVGDTVTVGEVSGLVTRIRMRATTITDWNRKELVVPNKNFITGELINWSLSDPILRMDFPIGIAYGSDTRLAHKIILETCRNHPNVIEQPESNVFFLGFGDNALAFEARVFVAEATNAARSRVLHELHMAIDDVCREHGITIAFPQRDLHLKSSEAVIKVANVSPEDAAYSEDADISGRLAPKKPKT